MAKLFVFAFFLIQFAVANGADTPCDNSEKFRLRGVSLRLENDAFAKTDRNYSHGMSITLESHDIKNYTQTACLPFLLRTHSRLITFLTPGFWAPGESGLQPNTVAVNFGQAMYTPGNPFRQDLIVNDRPYAGLIYVGIALNQRHTLQNSEFEVFDSREITLGAIGPLSFARETQNFVHDIFSDNRFLGWDNQLSNEPAFGLSIEKKFKKFKGTEAITPGFTYDIINAIGLQLGNIETSANYQIEGRVGWNLPNNFGSFAIRSGEESRPPELEDNDNAGPNATGIHFFTILGIKLVGYDFSLDGNLFHQSHRVTRRPWVSFGAVGIGLPTLLKKRRYNVSLMHVYRSGEFEEQDSTHSYRSVGLSVEF